MTHRWALDTEFLEDGKTIELISIALVNLDTDEEYYAGNITCDLGRVKADPWLAAHVVRHLPPCPSEFWRSRQTIARDLNALFGIAGGNVGHVTPEIWADYASYDWVALCQIYGRMIDLPKGMPMFCMDLQQSLRENGWEQSELPKQDEATKHSALEDARWLKRVIQHMECTTA